MSNTQVHQVQRAPQPAPKPSLPQVALPAQPTVVFDQNMVRFVYWVCRILAWVVAVIGCGLNVALILAALSEIDFDRAFALMRLGLGVAGILVTLVLTASILWFACVLSLLSQIEFKVRSHAEPS